MNHEHFMRRCLELAAEAREQGNTPVGSVVVLDGAIIGEGMVSHVALNSFTNYFNNVAGAAIEFPKAPTL